MDVSYSQYLTRTPDFSRATNLEVLVLKGCINLVEIHPSLECLSKLISLNLENCINLEYFPCTCGLVSLDDLSLFGCSKLKNFPKHSQDKPGPSKLDLDGTTLTDLLTCSSKHENVQENSGNLDSIVEFNSYDSTIKQLPSSNVVLRSSYFTSPHCTLTKLTRLNLSGTPIIHLPWNLERLSRLKRLEVTNCISLQALPVFPSSLQLLYASNCKSLELIYPESLCKTFGTTRAFFGNCFKLSKYPSKMEYAVQNVASHVNPAQWKYIYDNVSSLLF